MKTIYSFLFVAICSVMTSQAQDFSWGVIGGYNSAMLDNYFDEADDSNLSGYHGGLIAEFKVSDKFSFEPSLTYSLEGEDVTIQDETYSTEISYINFPVHMKYYLFDGFSVHAGPQIGFVLDAELGTESLFDDEDENPNEINDYVNSSFAASGGLGYDFDFGLFIKATYTHGVTDIFENSDAADLRTRTRVFRGSIGYKF